MLHPASNSSSPARRPARAGLLLLGLLLTVVLALPAALPARAQDATGGPEIDRTFTPPPCEPVVNNGVIVYQTYGKDGVTPASQLEVVDAQGKKVRTVKLDAPPIRLMPTPARNRVLAVTGKNATPAAIWLINASNGKQVRLDLPADDLGTLLYPTPQVNESASRRYIVLSNAQQTRAFLVDLESGRTTDLMAIAVKRAEGKQLTLIAAAVAPNDQTVLLWTPASVLAIPTDKPEGDRYVGNGSNLSGVGFLGDGAEIIYSQPYGTNQTEIVRYVVKTRQHARILLAGQGAYARSVPSGNYVLVADGGTVTLQDVHTVARAPLLQVKGSVTSLQLASDGAHALAGVKDGDTTAWWHLTLNTGASRQLDDLTGLSPLLPVTGAPRWLLFAPSNVVGVAQGGSPYYAVDLVGGTTVRVFTSQPGTTYLPPIVWPGQGRFTLLPTVGAERQDYQVLDDAVGTARPLLADPSQGAALSPDGCNAVTARLQGDLKGRDFRITIVGLGGERAPIEVGKGFGPLWLRGG